MIQTHVFYSGTVQGVGFRYTILRVAEDLNLCGWVRNLKDGRVEIKVEGPKEDIEKLIKNIEQHFNGYIKDKVLNSSPSQGEFSDFRIVF